jgi:hypothetical protein
MDKGKDRWGWLPAAMPKVAELIGRHRQAMGKEHVAECWDRAMRQGEPGWFYARQGQLAVGVPWPAIADAVMTPLKDDQAMVWLRPVGQGDAAH